MSKVENVIKRKQIPETHRERKEINDEIKRRTGYLSGITNGYPDD
jgi:hypothetical protein